MNYSSGAPAPKTMFQGCLNYAPAGGFSEKPQKSIVILRLLWDKRRSLALIALYAVVVSTALAFLIPSRYQSAAHLMPPDSQSNSGLAMAAAAMAGSVGGGALGGMASDLLGMKSNSDIFVGILLSRTAQDKLIQAV